VFTVKFLNYTVILKGVSKNCWDELIIAFKHAERALYSLYCIVMYDSTLFYYLFRWIQQQQQQKIQFIKEKLSRILCQTMITSSFTNWKAARQLRNLSPYWSHGHRLCRWVMPICLHRLGYGVDYRAWQGKRRGLFGFLLSFY
jgi:hypothetical protein